MRVAHNSKLTIQNSQFKIAIGNHSTFHIQHSTFKKKGDKHSQQAFVSFIIFSDLLSKKITQQRSPQP